MRRRKKGGRREEEAEGKRRKSVRIIWTAKDLLIEQNTRVKARSKG